MTQIAERDLQLGVVSAQLDTANANLASAVARVNQKNKLVRRDPAADLN